jgi:hypothetical protein
MKKLLPTLAIALLAVGLPTAATAGGGPAKSSFSGTLVAQDESSSTIRVTYRCHEGENLWIAAKQNADADKSTDFSTPESSGKAAVMQHSHRNPITCDGKTRTATFIVDTVEWGWGTIEKGWAWIQFCVSFGEGPDGDIELYDMGWVRSR